MTVDEIFSSESEHLYFRLVAARNALNAADDTETVQVLNNILDETLNNLTAIGTPEEISKAEEIVVRKSNKTVKDYLTSKRFSMIAMGIGLGAAAISLLVLCIILLGSNSEFKDKIKPIITIVLVGGGITAAALFVSSFMKKKMAEAREALQGKIVIGYRLDNETKSRSQSAKSSGKKESHGGRAKVVRNYGGILKLVIPLALIAVIGIVIYNNRDKIVTSAKEILYKTGLYDPSPAYSRERHDELRTTLLNTKKEIFYNEAEKLFEAEDYLKASEVYKECGNYKDAEGMSLVAVCSNYYLLAKEALPDSMSNALTNLNMLKKPNLDMLNGNYSEQFAEIKKTKTIMFEDTEKLISQYSNYLSYVATYKNSDDKFVIKDFAIRDYYVLYINEERLGWRKVTVVNDKDGYDFKLVEKNGEEDITWYIAEDNVLKVVGEEETVLKR